MDNKDLKYYLFPSSIKISRKPLYIHTILGSCVAVCMYDEERGAGGMNHYMLPVWNGKGLATPKYGNIAIVRLREQLIQSGARADMLKAKVFGGANVLGQKSDFHKIGERNISQAFTGLEELGIEIVSYSVGGDKGRKIIFDSSTGVIRQRMIERSRMKGLPVPEMKLRNDPKAQITDRR